MTAFTLGEATALALGRVRMTDGRTGPHAQDRSPARRLLPGQGATWVPARSGAPHRTGAPIRRDSIEAGTFEEHFFQIPAKGEPDRLLRMARAALDAGRRLKRAARAEGRVLSPAETALAGLTAGAVRVFEEICTLARLNEGRVFPSYDWLANATALGRATVARALRSLEIAGFLARQRRFKRVGPESGQGDEEHRNSGDGAGQGPRYAQTSNAYRALLPARLMPHLPRWMTPAPLPDDVVQRQQDRAVDVTTMHATLTCRELAETVVGGALGRVLAKLGARIDARETAAKKQAGCESHDKPQPLSDSIYSRKDGVGLVGQRGRPDGQER